MGGSQLRPPDSAISGKFPDPSDMFYKKESPTYSAAKAAEAAIRPCSVDSDEATKLRHYSSRYRTRSASKEACLEVRVEDGRNAGRVNGRGLSFHLRKAQTRSASGREDSQALGNDNISEILNELSNTPGSSALDPVELDSSSNILGKMTKEIDDKLELIDTVLPPILSTGSSTLRKISLRRTRSSFINNSTNTSGNAEEPNENRKRSRREEDEGGFKSNGKIGECNIGNLRSLDKGQSAISNQEDLSRKKVKQALRVFHTIYSRLTQETESKSKFEYRRSRIDLMALRLLKESNSELKFDSTFIGHVPGIEVGDEFHLRAELCMLGVHRQLQAGIDFLKKDGRILARSIISSGSSRYSDNGQISEVLIYSGSGPPDKDQKLEYGNLALKNSIDAQNLIRVIRGFEDIQIRKSKSSKSRKALRYIYDGLYLAEKFWIEKNDNDCDIFMFQLRRQQEQPELKIKQVKLRSSISFSDICVEDISCGKEKIPICAVNTIDEGSPQPFTYIKEIIYPSNYTQIPPKGCDCFGVCSDSIKCACAVKNGGELPFNGRGAIVQAKPLVYECGPLCKCAPSCHNRVSQYGIKFPLEVFKTKSMGWGLRSLAFISSGSFVCEYAGELIQDDDAQKRSDDEYLFAIGNNYHDAALWEGLPTSIPELQNSGSSEGDETNYTVDASIFGNVARFINHSCMPNLYAQNLLFDHGNKSMPHIMLFASEDIPPLQELTYHYNYTLDAVHDSNGNIKQKVCYCGTVECTGRLY
ncbi:Histone-lysine N-methyltransferase, H3 lysine-9 specific SUVH6 [Platanthera zijinensis]|uniref:Histone-lysine N-methyltransferase, H3 lysine-9 specific SUVH6 n=1 Tax=Platanthera zijinensis TaxID=2320716 RepID=A0AAP0FV46_9ASPA